MFASLSPEIRAPNLMRDLNVSGAFVSALTQIEESKLSKALRQLKPLSNEEGKRLIETLNRLLEIRDAIQPLQPDLKSAVNAAALIEALRGMTGETIRERISSLFVK